MAFMKMERYTKVIEKPARNEINGNLELVLQNYMNCNSISDTSYNQIHYFLAFIIAVVGR